MTRVLTVYTTSTGNTQQMAEAIADGARSVAGTEVQLKEVHEATKNNVAPSPELLQQFTQVSG